MVTITIPKSYPLGAELNLSVSPVVIKDVVPNSIASLYSVQKGDIIVSANWLPKVDAPKSAKEEPALKPVV